jgi:isopropylmalate/homocitrate/citramalate synthase
MARTVSICDVAPRDGLQNEPEVYAPAVRAELCRRLIAAGLRRVEAGSFVSPRAVPQMAGTDQVMADLGPQAAGVTVAALVVNHRGFEGALAAGATEIHVAYPITETFAQRNQNATLAEASAAAAGIVAAAHAVSLRATVTLGASFGCPFEGAVDPGMVAEHVGLMAAAGADEILLADTIGVGVPRQVRELVPAAIARSGGQVPIGLHLHNTRNTGYANAVAGLEAGVASLDASVAGLGGCPFAPRATGNIATEDLVYLLDHEGVESGLDLDALIRVAEWLEDAVLKRPMPGLVHRAGPFPAAQAAV